MPQNASGTRSRAYCTVNGRPIASETAAIPKSPRSTASRTVATVHTGRAASV